MKISKDLKNAIFDDFSSIYVRVSGEIKLSKPTTYGGVQIPLSRIFNDLTVGENFYLQDGKVYSKRDCLVQVNYHCLTTLEKGYLLVGNVNGSYREVVGMVSANTGVDRDYNCSCLVHMTPDSYLTFMLGKESAYSNVMIANTTCISAFVVKYLD